jgi:hypothetical protein
VVVLRHEKGTAFVMAVRSLIGLEPSFTRRFCYFLLLFNRASRLIITIEYMNRSSIYVASIIATTPFPEVEQTAKRYLDHIIA